MLNNQDLAELLESTRDRVSHMGGDAPASLGIVHVLDGLIAMLLEQAPRISSSQASSASEFQDEPAPQMEEATEPSPPPAPRRQVPARFRNRRREESATTPNPLLGPQYADFFKKLIADNTPRETRDEAIDEPPQPESSSPAPPAPAKPQYGGFFDALVQTQKALDATSSSSDQMEQASEQASSDAKPAPATPRFRDETATG